MSQYLGGVVGGVAVLVAIVVTNDMGLTQLLAVPAGFIGLVIGHYIDPSTKWGSGNTP